MTRDPDLTLSREDLYELVWSKPITEFAKDFGLSDATLAKRCRKLGPHREHVLSRLGSQVRENGKVFHGHS
jgi:hypothetical protein